MADEPTLYRDDLDVNGWVAFMQQTVADTNHDPGAIDGDFGPLTEAAVTSFQTDESLTPDGVCGNATWARLMGEPDVPGGVNRPRPAPRHGGGGGGGGGHHGGGGGTIQGVTFRFIEDPEYDASEDRIRYVAQNGGTATAPANGWYDVVVVTGPDGRQQMMENVQTDRDIEPGESYTGWTIPIGPLSAGNYHVHVGLDDNKGQQAEVDFNQAGEYMAFAADPTYDPASDTINYTARNDGHLTLSGGAAYDTIRVLAADGSAQMEAWPPIEDDVPPGGTYTRRTTTVGGPSGHYTATVSLGGDTGEVRELEFDVP